MESAQPKPTPRPTVGTIKRVNGAGDRVWFVTKATPHDLSGPAIVPLDIAGVEVDQECAVVTLSDGRPLVIARWDA